MSIKRLPFLLLLVLFLSACSSGAKGYRKNKTKKKKCDCPSWSMKNQGKPNSMQENAVYRTI